MGRGSPTRKALRRRNPEKRQRMNFLWRLPTEALVRKGFLGPNRKPKSGASWAVESGSGAALGGMNAAQGPQPFMLLVSFGIMGKGQPVGALRSAKDAISASLSAVKAQLRAAQQEEKRLARHWLLTGANEAGDDAVSVDALPMMAKVALILYDRAGYQPDAAAAYLAREAAKRKWEPKPEAAVKQLVSEVFLKANLEDYLSLCDAQGSSDAVAMQAALEFWIEWSLASWVKDANERLGVAPSTEAVLEKAEQMRLQETLEHRPASKGTAAGAKARSWCFRWRRRWGAHHGALRARDDVTVEEMRSKALVPNLFLGVDRGSILLLSVWGEGGI